MLNFGGVIHPPGCLVCVYDLDDLHHILRDVSPKYMAEMAQELDVKLGYLKLIPLLSYVELPVFVF